MSGGDRWSGGDDYERFMGRWSRPVGAAFVAWVGAPAGARWLDLGCGTGALTETILRNAAPASVVGVDPSPDFAGHAGRIVADPRARFAVGSADAIPLGDGAVDVAVSGLVLNFVPDPVAALTEQRRVVAPGGRIGAYVWDYAAGMEPLRRFWDAAVALDPGAAALDEGARFPLCAPDPLRAAFVEAGLRDVAVRSIDLPTVFAAFADFWTPFLSGVGPAPGYAMQLDEAGRDALRERIRSDLPIRPDGSIHLVARAWAARATTNGQARLVT